MGPEFFQTYMGRAYYEATMPRIAKALERIATALEVANERSKGDERQGGSGSGDGDPDEAMGRNGGRNG